jgi:tRNA(Ile)-lysidine synthase TilS/MesJ
VGGILRRRFNKVNGPMTSDQVRDGFTTRKRTSEERPSCSTESYKRNSFRPGIITGVSGGGWNQDLFLRKDTVFKRSYAHSKSNKRLKEEMPNCGLGSLAEFPQEVKLKKISFTLSIIY